MAVADSWVVVRPGPLTVPAPGILGNDFDAGGDPVRPHIESLPAHGTLRSFSDGSFTYKPVAGFEGLDSFTYVATDGGLASPVVSVSLHVTTSNQAPVGQPDTFITSENPSIEEGAPGVLANDSDPDGHPIRAELVPGSGPGPVDNFELRADGSFSLSPVASWDSDLSFRYRVTDGAVSSAPITVTIDIVAVNDPPIGEEDAYELVAGETLEVAAPGVLANDSDPVEGDVPHVHDLVSGPGHGELDLSEDGSFTYTPSLGSPGSTASPTGRLIPHQAT